MPDAYVLFLLALGIIVLLVAWLPLALRRIPLSLSILCVGLGAGVFALGWLDFDPDPELTTH